MSNRLSSLPTLLHSKSTPLHRYVVPNRSLWHEKPSSTLHPLFQAEPALYGPQAMSNGQMYGGWRPQAQSNFVVSCRSVCSVCCCVLELFCLCANLQPPPNMPQPAATSIPQQPQELTQTATIRNAVNLKKNTIKLVPLADSPNKFSIHFVFDASTSCRLVHLILLSV